MNEEIIYFDNAASTLKKPKTVIEAVNNCLLNYCANPGRSGHKLALKAGRAVYDAREAIAGFFGITDPLRLVFTSGATESLNLAIKGTLLKGDHVIATCMEHNSVLRPLSRLKEDGVEVSIIECSGEGPVDVTDIENAIKPNTKLVICTHASNVTGTIMPIKELGAMCRKHGVLFLVDAAQSAGVFEINTTDMSIDMLAVPGHKYMMGMQGIGVLYIGERANVTPIKEGGTGSISAQITQPDTIPDRYESGTLNLPGIVSLRSAISFINDIGLSEILAHETNLTRIFLEGVRNINGATVYGHKCTKYRCPEHKHTNYKDRDCNFLEKHVFATATVAMNLDNISSSEFASILDEDFNICTRAGLHCAPLAHKTLGTFEKASVRFSFSYFNTIDEINKGIEAIYQISKR